MPDKKNLPAPLARTPIASLKHVLHCGYSRFRNTKQKQGMKKINIFFMPGVL